MNPVAVTSKSITWVRKQAEMALYRQWKESMNGGGIDVRESGS